MITSAFTHSAREWIPTKAETLEAMLATKEPNEKYSALMHPSTQEFIDHNTYSGHLAPRDFTTGHATESDNIQDAQDLANEAKLEQKEKEENAEQTRDGMTASIESFKEYQEKLIEGYDFTHADLEETLDDIINDKEAFQAKHGLTDEEADRALDHAIIMKGMTREEREAYLEKLEKTDPDVAKALENDAKENNQQKLENKSSISSEASVAETSIVEDDMLADLDELDFDPAELLVKAEDSSFAQSVIEDTEATLAKSNIASSTPSVDAETREVANNAVAPITPKGFEIG